MQAAARGSRYAQEIRGKQAGRTYPLPQMRYLLQTYHGTEDDLLRGQSHVRHDRRAPGRRRSESGEEKEGGKYKKASVEDIFEAIMGAIYIDLGYKTVRKVVLDIIVPYIKDPNTIFFSDYKSVLQEFVQTEQKSLEYVLIKEEGPAHDKKFTTEVMIDDISYGIGVGKSKKMSEQNAAKEALSKLAK